MILIDRKANCKATEEVDTRAKVKRRRNMKDKVEVALSKVRPALQADGGDVELVDVTEGVVKLKLRGACAGCPMSTMTLKMGIERLLREEIPEIKEVVAV
jgi:Fe-S cluster biogenesis protein NfuA